MPFSASDILIGRLALQGVVTADFVWDINENNGDFAANAWDLGNFAIDTALIWNPIVKPAAIGTAIRISATSVVATTVVYPVVVGLAAGVVAGTGAIALAEATGVAPVGSTDLAIDFYTGQGDYASYFDIPGNIETIRESDPIGRARTRATSVVAEVLQNISPILSFFQQKAKKRTSNRRRRLWFA